MHIPTDATALDRMTIVELDDLRHMLRLEKGDLCRRAGVSPSSYWRWMRFARGESKGVEPHPRLLGAVREALRRELEGRRRFDRIAS
jgi:transcriptional regulator with XRE-family HTH domain